MKEIENQIPVQHVDPADLNSLEFKGDSFHFQRSVGQNPELMDRSVLKLNLQYALYFDLKNSDPCTPECLPDVLVGELIEATSQAFVAESFPTKYIRFFKGSKLMKNDTPMKAYFSTKGVSTNNTIRVELYNVLKLDICQKKTIWLPYSSELKRVQDLRQQLSYEDVRGVNANLKQDNYMDLMMFAFKKRIIIEDIDLSVLIP